MQYFNYRTKSDFSSSKSRLSQHEQAQDLIVHCAERALVPSLLFLAPWNQLKPFHSLRRVQTMVGKWCSAARCSTRSCPLAARILVPRSLPAAAPVYLLSLLRAAARAAHRSELCPLLRVGPAAATATPARLFLRQHSRSSHIVHKKCLSAVRKCISMSDVSAQELTISWLLYRVQSQVTHLITSPHQQAVMRIRTTKQKRNGAEPIPRSSSSPPMHHLHAQGCRVNLSLWNNYFLMLVCSPMP